MLCFKTDVQWYAKVKLYILIFASKIFPVWTCGSECVPGETDL